MKNSRTKIYEQTTTGGAVVNVGGHVDLPLSQFDRPGPTGQRYGEKPIVPVEMVATQLAVERPPIDDENFVPISRAQLSLAAAEIAKEVPEDQIKVFYKKIKDLAQECVDSDETKDLNDRGEKEMSEVRKSVYKNRLVKMINEALDDLDRPRFSTSKWGEDPETPGEFESPDDEPKTIEQEQEEFERKFAKLDDLAKEFAFEHGGGARQWIVAIARRIKEFSDNVNDESLVELQNMAVADFIDMLETSGLIEAEDAEEMMNSYDEVMLLPSFRYFFVVAFVLPAFKIAEKSREDDIRDVLEGIGIPRQIQDSIFYQLVGRVQKNPAAIRDRFAYFTNNQFEIKNRKGGGTGNYDQLTPKRAADLMKNLSKAMPSLERRANLPVDYLAVAETYYDSLSDREKAQFLLDALDYTQEDAEGVKSYKVGKRKI